MRDMPTMESIKRADGLLTTYARERPKHDTGAEYLRETIARGIDAAVAAEREACAKIAEDVDHGGPGCGPGYCVHVAERIRARGER